MTKWWKTDFTDWCCNFRSTACQKKKIYSDLNIGTWTVYEVPDWVFYIKETIWWEKKDYGYYRTGKYQVWIRHLCYGEEQVKNSTEPPWARTNPNDIYGEEEEELTEAIEGQRRASGIWSAQVDAAAVDEAEVRVDGGGGARVLWRP